MDPSQALRSPSPGLTLSLRHGTASRLCLGLFVAQAILCSAISVLGVPPLVNPRWPGVALLVLASASSLISLCRWLPWQNVLSSAALIGVLGTLIECLATNGSHLMEPASTGGPSAISLWPLALVWILAVLNCRGVARLVLQRWRTQPNYGFLLLGLTAVLVVTLIESFLRFGSGLFPAVAHVSPGSAGPAARSVVYLLLGSGIVLLAATPYLINKRPVPQPVDWHPLILWGALNGWLFAVALVKKDWGGAGLLLLEVPGAAGFAWVSSRQHQPSGKQTVLV